MTIIEHPRSRTYLMLVILVLTAFISCSKKKEPNHPPKLIINHSIEGLNVILTGSASDIDGTIDQVYINWGDNQSDKLIGGNVSNIQISHAYLKSETVDITITTYDNDGAISVKIINTDVGYKEVDLGNIKDSMYKTANNEYLILTINLHTYQESQQQEKFAMLTQLIGKMEVDFIAFQECAQHKSSPLVTGIIRKNNMALIISNALKEHFHVDYNFVWHWAHYGWNVFEEGVALMSKHAILDSDSRYISTNTSVTNITSRKVIYGSFQIPEGKINLFSAHTHWRTSATDEEQNDQIKNIQLMLNQKEVLNPVIGSFVCGDFNVNPTSNYPWSEGYNTMINNGAYIDTYLKIYTNANNIPAQSIYNTVGGTYPGRIDYIFMKNDAHFRLVDSQIIFTHDVIGTISDHYGVLTKIAFNP